MTLRETLGRIAKAGPPPNEEAAKFQIIVPVLGDLGWDVYNSHGTDEVRYEHQAGGSRSGGRVDIALMGRHDQCACFVEAKAPGVNLDDRVARLLGYASHDGVTVCVLTDGLEWRLYLPREAGPPDNRRFALLHLRDDPVEQSADDLEAFLSRDAVRSGKAERDAAKALKRLREESDIVRRLPEIWRKMLTKPDGDLIELVRTKVYAELRLSPSADQVAAALSVREVATPSRPAQAPNHGRPAPGGASAGEQRAKPRKIQSATVLGVHKELRTWKGLVVHVAEQLRVRHPHDFFAMASQLKGRKHYYVSRDARGMTEPREIGVTGIFIETHASASNIINRAHQLLELFGYSASDLEIHEE